jgi:transcriptional regulator with XRE-family HTH domain
LVTNDLTGHQNGDSIDGMQLAAYLKMNGISDEDFGQIIGVSRQAVHRYKTFGRSPKRETLALILEATGGAVTPNDFLQDQSALVGVSEQQGAA